MAIEDAVVLAKCLRDVPGIEAAFTAYEALRRERVERWWRTEEERHRQGTRTDRQGHS